jgi:hypothetical protein
MIAHKMSMALQRAGAVLALATMSHADPRCVAGNNASALVNGNECGSGYSQGLVMKVGDACTSHHLCGPLNTGGAYPCLCRDATSYREGEFRSTCQNGKPDKGCCKEHRKLRSAKQQDRCDDGWGFAPILIVSIVLIASLVGMHACMRVRPL